MSRYFAVTRRAGKAWATGVPMRQQAEWREHAAYMDGMFEDRSLLFAGPIVGTSTHEVLLIFQAEDMETVMDLLAEDNWTKMDILAHNSADIREWNILLNALKA